MLKRVLLALGTFGVVLIAYAVYNMAAGDKAAVRQTLTVTPNDEDFKDLEEAAGREVIESPDPEQFELTQGSGGEIVIFDPKTQERRLIFRAQEWQDVADNEYHMTSPIIRLLTPRGQIVEVRADEGQIVMDKRGKSYDPRRGWLKGNVVIFIDRTTPQWRHDHPDRAEMEQHREQVVTMWLDGVAFDLDLSRLETDGPFRVQSKEADVEGEGLVLRWNQNQQRIEELQITKGKRMAMRGRKLAKFALPGSGEAAEEVERKAGAEPSLAMRPVRLIDIEESPPVDLPASATNERIALASAADEAIETPAPEEPPAEPVAEVDEGPKMIDGEEVLDLGVAATQRKRKDSPTIYEARFDGGVEVRQTDKGEVSGRLLAELVELTFDFGNRQRDVLDSAPSEEEEEQIEAGTGIELTWGGLFRMEPVDRPVAPSGGNRLLVHAVGSPVRLEAGQGFATCEDFTFANESKRARLIGTDESWVVVEGKGGDQISGPRIMLDQKEGVARIDGAGSMHRPTRRDGNDARAVSIAWERGVDVRFGMLGGQEYLQEATFVGGVHFTQGADTSVEGEWVRALFSPPRRKREKKSDNGLSLELDGSIDRLDCRDSVRLAQGDDEIQCDKLLVDMGAGVDGEPFPREANAWGNVRVKQGDAHLQAGEHMFVRMELPDRRAQRAGRTAAQIVEMTGSGGVLAVDPDAKLNVRADEMACTFEGVNQLRTARIIGTASRPASVEKDDYRVRGPRVEIDASNPSLLVRGAGQLEFKSDRRLDGQPSDHPVPVTVSFSKQLDLRGQDNVIRIDGDVEAVSRDADQPRKFDFSREGPRQTEEYTLACEHLEIGLADERKPQGEAKDENASPFDFVLGDTGRAKATRGLLAALSVDRMLRPGGVPVVVMSELAATQMQMPSRRPAPVAPVRQNVDLKLAKRPVSVLAKDNAVASLSMIDPATRAVNSRMQIAGPKITSDLVRQRLNVEGAGHMLIEDYRLPGAGAARKREAVDPLLGDMGGSGPSQSLFSWENSLTYLRARRLGILDRGVEVIHRSGSQMAYAEQLAKSRNVPADALRRMGGRRVQMTCDNMMVEFLNDFGGAPGDGGAAALKRFQATGAVHLQDGTKSILGQRISYWQETEIVQIEGGAGEPARFFDADAKTGHIRQQIQGDLLQWNRAARRVEVTRPTVLANRP